MAVVKSLNDDYVITNKINASANIILSTNTVFRSQIELSQLMQAKQVRALLKIQQVLKLIADH
jgi:hypothetical protein